MAERWEIVRENFFCIFYTKEFEKQLYVAERLFNIMANYKIKMINLLNFVNI